MTAIPEIDENVKTDIEAAIYRKLIDHLRKYPEVQNIDLMNLAYFCRNCFSKWYMAEAGERGIALDYDQAREIVYGMPYSEYKSQHQGKATEEQLSKYEESQNKATE